MLAQRPYIVSAHAHFFNAPEPKGKRAPSFLSLLKSTNTGCFFVVEVDHVGRVPHGIGAKQDDVSDIASHASETNVTVLASITTLRGELQLALAGTHWPRNAASTLPPVMARDALEVTTASARNKALIRFTVFPP
jgi:hypothetical protein